MRSGGPLNDDELCLWRMWVIHALHPRSTRAYEVISANAHLLIGDKMPECVLDFCARKAGYDVRIERWKQKDHSEHVSVVRHPGDALYDYVAQSFTDLKKKPGRIARNNSTRGENDGRPGNRVN